MAQKRKRRMCNQIKKQLDPLPIQSSRCFPRFTFKQYITRLMLTEYNEHI